MSFGQKRITLPEPDDDCREAALREEIEHGGTALASRAVVDQAIIGVVVTHGRLPPRQAREVLPEVSQHTDTELREVAARLVQWQTRTRLPPEIRTTLDTVLRPRKPSPAAKSSPTPAFDTAGRTVPPPPRPPA
ncbi:ANTAR domain-containing protein [Streptomyces echinatus]|uniref:ANTAR domain-containing protein n=1 Tax=Streptomyces echinatus TaxID=67293 RepID=UPI0037A4AE1C